MDFHVAAPDHCNYVEVIFADPASRVLPNADPSSGITIIPTHVSEKYFKECLERVKKHHFKYFQKSFKSYVCRDLVLENYDHKDMKVYRKEVLKADTSKLKTEGTLTCFSRKEKIPYHAFPSTTSIHGIFYTNRLTMRVNNRLYLNFDVEHYPEDDTTLFRIFMNYNHDSNVDAEHATMSVGTLIRSLQ